MNSKKCSRCEKTVYPLEELKCLDKIWHKLCFKCQECGMTLNMKTYKGFEKLPYCNAHCPQAKHTQVAETPETKRLAENTRIQSNVKYHEDFEKQKGKVTQVADDPETVRIKSAGKIISNVAYHGDLEKKQKMEQKRHLVPDGSNGVPSPSLSPGSPNSIKNSPVHNVVNYDPPSNHHDSPYSGKQTSTVIYTSQEGPVQNSPSKRIGSIADYDPLNDNYGSVVGGSHPNAPHFYPGGGQAITGFQQHISPARTQPIRVYRAMYDYTAQDSDEISFLDGDIIADCKSIDEGWMSGTVQRTGQTGMLPANYVEPVN